MTNKEWLAKHPEEITSKMLVNAAKYARENNYPDFYSGYQLLDDWLNAEHEEPESTVVTTFEVTQIIKGETPMPSALNEVAEINAKRIKRILAADDVNAVKFQVFVRGEK